MRWKRNRYRFAIVVAAREVNDERAFLAAPDAIRPGIDPKVVDIVRTRQDTKGLDPKEAVVNEALALANGDPNSCRQLVKAFEIQREKNSEPLSPNQTAVLRTLFTLVHSTQYYRDNQSTYVSDLAGFVNYELKSRGERTVLAPRAVGAILRIFGIPTRRCS